jgi:formate hydrogenlyase transcriptional activator
MPSQSSIRPETIRARYEALLDVGESIVSQHHLSTLISDLSRSLRQLVSFDFIALTLVDHENRVVRLHILETAEPGEHEIPEPVRFDETPTIEALRRRDVFYVPCIGEESRFPTVINRLRQAGIESVCILPLLTSQHEIGGLHFGSRGRDAYSPEDIEFMRLIARQVALAVDNALSYEKIQELNARLAEEKVYLEGEIRTDRQFTEIVGESRGLASLLRQVETVAPTGSNVLIIGEPGTGKELAARAIHDLSSRRTGTFVRLNCAAAPAGMLESEMFGHEKGAFPGAGSQRIGRFELADGGTIFLDEIAEIPPDLQAKLLRAIQDKEFERLGCARTLRSDARLIAATNKDLRLMVEDGSFRADLFYILSVFPITVPPLRDRREDIPVLVRYFVQQSSRRMNRRITQIPAEAMQVMSHYDWPGNIRELQTFIERAVILSPGPSLNAPLRELRRSWRNSGTVVTMAVAERRAILHALTEAGGRVGGAAGAAAKLGMKRTTLQARMRKLGISRSHIVP